MSKRAVNITPIILSGGFGTRLWPLSNAGSPKPYIQIDSSETLIQKTVKRALNIPSVNEVVIVCNEMHYNKAFQQLEQFSNEVSITYILEPTMRDSSAAIAIAAHYTFQKYGHDCLLLIMPSDHLVRKEVELLKSLDLAMPLAESGNIVAFGITPTAPKTEYGYILCDGTDVLKFVEKPDLNTAKHYLDAGNYLWNSGIYFASSSTLLSELKQFEPEIHALTSKAFLSATSQTIGHTTKYVIDIENYKPIKAISIDYAICEKSKNIKAIGCDLGWSDVGSWEELSTLYQKDAFGNNSSGNVVLNKTSNSIIFGNDRLVAAIGIDDLIIVDTKDALLICHKEQSHKIKELANQLLAKESDEA